MLWTATLYQDPQSGTPTTYTLNSAYGLPRQGSQELVNGGTAIVLAGRWAVAAGTQADPDAVVYQLNPDDPPNGVAFLRVGDDLLHVLNRDRALLVGNGAWSFTLNRTDNRDPAIGDGPLNLEPPRPTRPPAPSMPTGSLVLGVFEGRMPCHAIVFELAAVAPYPGCFLIKQQLTLYQDEATGAPSRYLFQGTSTVRDGTWAILQGTASDSQAVVYQLQLGNAQPPVSFLSADENNLYLLDQDLNLLVGDAQFSYTLSRTEGGS
jgi:hypothetical protein